MTIQKHFHRFFTQQYKLTRTKKAMIYDSYKTGYHIYSFAMRKYKIFHCLLYSNSNIAYSLILHDDSYHIKHAHP